MLFVFDYLRFSGRLHLGRASVQLVVARFVIVRELRLARVLLQVLMVLNAT